jgi:hypothetical protein
VEAGAGEESGNTRRPITGKSVLSLVTMAATKSGNLLTGMYLDLPAGRSLPVASVDVGAGADLARI